MGTEKDMNDKIDLINNKIERMEEKQDKLSTDVQAFILEVRTWRSEKESNCRWHQEKTEHCVEAIDGNGKPGIKADVQEMQQNWSITKYILGILVPYIVIATGIGIWFAIHSNPVSKYIEQPKSEQVKQ